MKKYVKPDLFYENFELSQHIAACAWDMNDSQNVETCSAVSDSTWGVPEGLHAFNSVAVCTDGPLDSYCYTNGSSGINIFNS